MSVTKNLGGGGGGVEIDCKHDFFVDFCLHQKIKEVPNIFDTQAFFF